MSLDLSLLDVILTVIIGLSIVFGLVKGFIRELFSLAFFILAVILSFMYYFEAGNLFVTQLKNRDLANFTGFLLIFIAVMVVGALMTWTTKKIFVIGPLRSVDRILGGAFGLLRGILIAAVIVFGVVVFSVDEGMVRRSRLSPVILKAISLGIDLLPNKFRERLPRVEYQNGQENQRTGRSV